MDRFVLQNSFTKEDNRTVIKFFVLLNKSPTEIHEIIQQGLQDWCPSYETIRRWVKSFREGREDTADDHRSGRPITATSASVVEKVSNAIDKDRRLTTREVAEVVGISHDSAHKILTVDLGKKKLCARWIPHLLTDEQKGIRITISSNHLRQYKRQGNACLNRLVACDETWAHSWEPELKRQSSSWCGSYSPRPQKATINESAV